MRKLIATAAAALVLVLSVPAPCAQGREWAGREWSKVVR